MRRRSIKFITVGCILMATFLWFNRFRLVKFYYMHQFFKNSPNKLIKSHEKEFLEDRSILSQYSLFSPSDGSQDAGPYLNPMLHWQIGDIHHLGNLTLPEFIHKEMNDDWVIKKPLFKKMGMNFNWMKELLKYDVWSPELSSPAYPLAKKYDTYSYPLPTYRDLQTWAKLRYLYGKETGDVQNALKEVRHLMRLIWTNDNLVSSMVVLGMLKLENQFEEIITPKEMGDWKFISHDHLMRAKRYFYSLPSMVDIRLPDETFEKATNVTAGLCLMLHEGSLQYLNLRQLLQKELKYSYKRMENKIASSNCRKTFYNQIWKDPQWRILTNLDGVTVLGKEVTLEKVKHDSDLKAAVGFMLANVGDTIHFQYGK